MVAGGKVMIWLSKKDSNERDTITCNMFVSSESN